MFLEARVRAIQMHPAQQETPDIRAVPTLIRPAVHRDKQEVQSKNIHIIKVIPINFFVDSKLEA
jgi:hypothetical protein